MQKLLSLFMIVLLLCLLVACGNNEQEPSGTPSESSQTQLPESSEPTPSDEPSEPENDPTGATTTDEPSGSNDKSTGTSTTGAPSGSNNKSTGTSKDETNNAQSTQSSDGKQTTGRSVRTTSTKKSTTKGSKTTVTATTATTSRNNATTKTTVKREDPMTDYQSNHYADCISYRTPLTNTYNKLTKDKELTIVYFGGSLTNGYGCSDIDQYSWRARSGQWFKKNFPNADIHTVDTAIGESGTYLGTYRVQKDVIGSKPDLLFIEYAINDAYSGADEKTAAMRFETIVREVRQALPYCDIVTILTTDVNYATQSKNLQLFPTAKGHNTIAEAYDLPVLNIGAGMVRNLADITKNSLWWKDSSIWNTYFIDSVHPNDDGHEQYYLCVEEYLENALLNTDYNGFSSAKHSIPAVQSNHLLDGNRLSVKGADMQKYCVAKQTANATFNAGTFVSSTSQTPHIGYYEVAKGGKITFKFNGTEFAFWVDRKNPVKFSYSIDGGTSVTKTFDKSSPTQVVTGLSSGEHTITIHASAASIKIGALFTRDETKQTLKGAK